LSYKKKKELTSLDFMIEGMIARAIELTKQDFDRKNSARLVSERRREKPSYFFKNSRVIPLRKKRVTDG
jgi:hypothetical protein